MNKIIITLILIVFFPACKSKENTHYLRGNERPREIEGRSCNCRLDPNEHKPLAETKTDYTYNGAFTTVMYLCDILDPVAIKQENPTRIEDGIIKNYLFAVSIGKTFDGKPPIINRESPYEEYTAVGKSHNCYIAVNPLIGIEVPPSARCQQDIINYLGQNDFLHERCFDSTLPAKD